MKSERDLPRSAGIRDRLRDATREDHERLHRHTHFAALLDGDLGMVGYKDLISRLHGFYAPLDAAIGCVLTGGGNDPLAYDFTKRSGMLSEDLQHLGMSHAEIGALARCEQAARMVTRDGLGGVLYVIEGATLGGARLDRVARDVLGHDAVAGRTLWAWCRAQSAKRWKAANTFLEVQHREGIPLEVLEAAARETFRVIADWLAPLEKPGQKIGAA